MTSEDLDDGAKDKNDGEELGRAVELNKRIVPVLRRPVDGMEAPPALADMPRATLRSTCGKWCRT